jgi:hypothetical protein
MAGDRLSLTHDIDFLVRQLTKRDVSVPDVLLEARWSACGAS